MTIPKPGPSEVLIIADGRATIISREQFERMRLGDGGGCIPEQPIASRPVSAENLDESWRRVLALLSENNDEEREE